MANNNDNKNDNSNNGNDRRQHHRLEDNPFIAFRRFADSQVSSLLNTVFALPATLASYNNAHQAREQCLFGKADQRQCDRLHEIEAHIAELRNEGRELFRAGDVQAVLRNSEELVRLDRKADVIRRDILGPSNSEIQTQQPWPNETELVERVANRKGQEWGWAWDWGFPRPFDHERRNLGDTSEGQDAKDFMALDRLLRMQAEASRLAQEFDDKAWDDSAAHVVRFDNCSETQVSDGKPRVWSWSKSWQFPPRPDASQPDDDAYSPRALEQNRALDTAGVPWRAAYEDLLRAEKIPISQQQLAQTTQQDGEPKCPSGMDIDAWWSQPATRQELGERIQRGEEPRYQPLTAQDEPSYEYSHDHEDQPDDPPTPKHNQFPSLHGFRQDPATYADREAAQFEEYAKDHDDHETEMDAYERLDAASANTAMSAPTNAFNSVTSALLEKKKDEVKPSLLSTLTTTERTVAPDGSVTTKVLLKKRFADGHEESTETVHTQRGRETDLPAKDPWEALKNAQSRSSEAGDGQTKKRSGWFWSS